MVFADATQLLRGKNFSAWTQWRTQLMRSPAEYAEAVKAAGPIQPHVDPLLAKSPEVYAKFLVELQQRGLLSFSQERSHTVGVFFVRKKSSDELRLIIDTRMANLRFRDLWSTSLPSAAALAALETPDDSESELIEDEEDVQCAFYRIKSPDGMSE